MQTDREIRQSTYLAIGTFVAVQCGALFLGLALQCILSRRLSEIDYVRFVACISLTSTLSVLVGGAAPKAVARLVAIDPGWTCRGMSILRRVHLCCCGALACLLILVAPLLGHFYGSSVITAALCLLAIEFWLRAGLAEPVWQVLNGLGEHRCQVRLMGVHSLIRACVTAGIVVFDPTVRGAVVGLLITASVSAVLAQIASRSLPKSGPAIADQGLDHITFEVRRWWTYGAFVDACLFFLPPAILWITMAYSANHSELAMLTASYILGQAIVPVLQAINRGFVRLTAINDKHASTSQARSVLSEVLQGLLPIAGLGLLLTFYGGAWLVGVLFGANYRSAWWLPGVVVLGMFSLSISHLFSEALGNCGKLKARFLCMLVVALCSLAMTFGLSRYWGSSGGAVAIGATGVAVMLALGRILQLRIGDFSPWKGIKEVAISACLAGASCSLMSGRIGQDHWPYLLTIPVVYVLGLLLTDEPGSRPLFQFLAARVRRLSVQTK